MDSVTWQGVFLWFWVEVGGEQAAGVGEEQLEVKWGL